MNGSKKRASVQPLYERLGEIALFNQKKVLDAFRNNKLAIRHFAPSTGYGYGDEGRDVLNRIMADIFRAEAAVLSPNIVSGTHALALGLYAILRPGDVFLSITGTPYDTLIDVIDGKGNGSLKDFGISFETIPLKNGGFDFEAIEAYLAFRQPKMIYLQRSRGYEWRSALNISQIGKPYAEYGKQAIRAALCWIIVTGNLWRNRNRLKRAWISLPAL